MNDETLTTAGVGGVKAVSAGGSPPADTAFTLRSDVAAAAATASAGPAGPALAFDEFQRRAAAFAVYPPEADVAYPILGLLDEVGELAMKVYTRLLACRVPTDPADTLYPVLLQCLEGAARVGDAAGRRNKAIRDGRHLTAGDAALAAELGDVLRSPGHLTPLTREGGDVLWYLSDLCKALRVRLGDVAGGCLAKLDDRAARGVIHGSGDNR